MPVAPLAWRAIAVSALTVLFGGVVSPAQSPGVLVPADTILTNGKIFTSNAAHPYVQALAIRGDRIIAAGDTTSIAALAGPETERIDLGGRTVIPGINDAHNHLEIGPADAVELQFDSFDPTWDQVKAKIIAAVAEKPKGSFIDADVGGNIFHDPGVNRRTLDQVSPDDPIILTTLTGHAGIANSAALRAASIRDDQKDPIGARFERFPDGKLSGVLREYARMEINRDLADRTSDNDAVAELRDTLDEAAKLGITTIQDMSNAMPIIDPAGKDGGFHRNRARLGQSADPAVQFPASRSNLAFLLDAASRILHAKADRFLVYIKSNEVHSL